MGVGIGVGICAGMNQRAVFAARDAAWLADTDGQAIIAAMDVEPDRLAKLRVGGFVVESKRAGLWSKLDSLFNFAAHDEQAARVDWKDPSRVATANGSPTFVDGLGYEFDGTDDYLATGFIPSTHCTQATGTAGFHGIYERTDLAQTGLGYSASVNTTTSLSMIPRNATNLCAGQYNHTATGNQVASTDSRGLWIVQRDGANIEYFYRGVSQGTKAPASVGSGLPGIQFFIGCRNNNGVADTFRASRPVAWVVGGLLTTDEQGALYRLIHRFLPPAARA